MVYWTLQKSKSNIYHRPFSAPINQQGAGRGIHNPVDCLLIECAEIGNGWNGLSIWLMHEHEGDLLIDYKPGLWLAAWDDCRFVSSQWSSSRYRPRLSIRDVLAAPEAYAVHLELAKTMGKEPRAVVNHDQLRPYLLSETSFDGKVTPNYWIDELKWRREFDLAACPRMTYKSLIVVSDLHLDTPVNPCTNKRPTVPDQIDAFREFMDGC